MRGKKEFLSIADIKNWLSNNNWVDTSTETEIIFYNRNIYIILKETAKKITYTDLNTGLCLESKLDKIWMDETKSLCLSNQIFLLSKEATEFFKNNFGGDKLGYAI